jgi:hypothetical protein
LISRPAHRPSTDKADIDLILKRLKVAEKLAQEMRDE